MQVAVHELEDMEIEKLPQNPKMDSHLRVSVFLQMGDEQLTCIRGVEHGSVREGVTL